jgi:hypothetical protein
MLFRRLSQRPLQTRQAFDDRTHLVAQIQPHVERHLIVAATRGVQLAARRTDFFSQTPLDVHVDVFVGGREGEPAGVDFALDGAQTKNDFRGVARGNNALLAEHLGMGNTAHDVVAI